MPSPVLGVEEVERAGVDRDLSLIALAGAGAGAEAADEGRPALGGRLFDLAGTGVLQLARGPRP